mmetsp:Transcript_5433/g.13599  ORF Transcript_5433/g.13599 Transcript_5433/m.13599 type:complete len:604 (-) Transcript_5433:1440-3251(-)
MVRFKNAPHGHHYSGGTGSRFNDGASYVTDTSSITNPVELAFSSSDEDEGGDAISFFDSATSVLTGMTGWTSANGGAKGNAAGDVSEMDESENFPMAHSKSYLSTLSEGVESDVSELASEHISTISFAVNGSIETSFDETEVLSHVPSYRSKNSMTQQRRGANNGRSPLAPIPPTSPSKMVQFRSPSISSDPQMPSRPASKFDAGGVAAPSISPTSSTLSNTSSKSKKRAPVPPLRNPNMDDKEEDQIWEEDCNYDINPTLMFLVLESHDWKEATSLLDGKGLENKNQAWNLGQLFGIKKKEADAADLSKKRQSELRAQARTWITRRERNGTLRWRMLPLHSALAFNAPFEVALRLYHLYPGAVRCRNDQGMLPLHHVFKFGNEDKILELMLDVFPEALTVADDKGRLPVESTPKDGSDNERRSNILTLFSNFQLEIAKKKELTMAADDDPAKNPTAGNPLPLTNVQPASSHPPTLAEKEQEGTLGAVPRYTANTDYNQVTYNAIKPIPPQKKTPQQVPNINAPQSLQPGDEEDSITDRYATFSSEDGENIPFNPMGLSPIPEEGTMSPKARTALKQELLLLGEKKKRKGLRKLFKKKREIQM